MKAIQSGLLKITVFILLLLSMVSAPLFAESKLTKEQTEELEKYQAWAKGIWDSLDRQIGEIKLDNAVATLNVPDNFYFLNASDAEKVLVDIWGNPPGQSTLGMLFPSEMTPFDEGSWAVTIEYEEDGYVSDDDADEIDYFKLLDQMKSDVNDASRERVKQGYEEIELIGWAAAPYYQKESHKLHWAKELRFGDRPVNTLNYNIRVLGRKGVLVLNFIAQINQKNLIDSELETVLAMAEFDTGNTYSDFDPDIDDVAAYGIGALVAGKLIAKTGLLAAAFIFLKKFAIIFIIAIGAFLKKLFSGKREKAES